MSLLQRLTTLTSIRLTMVGLRSTTSEDIQHRSSVTLARDPVVQRTPVRVHLDTRATFETLFTDSTWQTPCQAVQLSLV